MLRRLQSGESFWSSVYALFQRREIARADVIEVVARGLEQARGDYRVLVRRFNMPSRDYQRFLAFLRKHDCLPMQGRPPGREFSRPPQQ